jgi:hypothetical protein
VFNTARIEALEVDNLIEAPRPPWCRPPPARNAVAPTPCATTSVAPTTQCPLGRNDAEVDEAHPVVQRQATA